LYFSGTVYAENTDGAYRELFLADGYKKLCDTGFTAAYRKEKAANILDDMLGAAGITEKAVTCPDVEPARFSCRAGTAGLGMINGAELMKRLLDAAPGEGQVVIIEFLCWNPAYPFAAGIWADGYEADDFGKDRFIITDGGGMKFEVDAGGRGMTLDNGGGCVVKLEKGNKVSLDNGDIELVSGPEGGGRI
jgi:hypothetical protein